MVEFGIKLTLLNFNQGNARDIINTVFLYICNL